MGAASEPIVFDATVHKVQNVTSGGCRIAFDTTRKFVTESALLLAMADSPGVIVRVTVQRIAWRPSFPYAPDEEK